MIFTIGIVMCIGCLVAYVARLRAVALALSWFCGLPCRCKVLCTGLYSTLLSGSGTAKCVVWS